MFNTNNGKLTNKQNKVSPNQKSVVDNPYASSSINQETDYIFAGPDIETVRAESDKTTRNIHALVICFTGIRCFKVPSK